MYCFRFEEATVRDRVTRVVLLWVNNHFTDFETDPSMMEFLETFEVGLEREKMHGQLRLLNIACAAKARTRNVTLARPSRDEVLQFNILGGYEKGFGIFISKVTYLTIYHLYICYSEINKIILLKHCKSYNRT